MNDPALGWYLPPGVREQDIPGNQEWIEECSKCHKLFDVNEEGKVNDETAICGDCLNE